MSFGRVYMRIFDAHIYALLLNTIYMGTKHAYISVQNTHIYMRTKDAYIRVQKMHIFAYETRIYLLTSEQLVSLAGITNSMQRILISKPGEKQGGIRNGELL